MEITSTSDGALDDNTRSLEARILRARAAAQAGASEIYVPLSIWDHDYADLVLVQPVEVDDAPFGEPFTGLAALAEPHTAHIIVSEMPATRFLRLTPTHATQSYAPMIIDVHSCHPVGGWGFHVEGAIVPPHSDPAPRKTNSSDD